MKEWVVIQKSETASKINDGYLALKALLDIQLTYVLTVNGW